MSNKKFIPVNEPLLTGNIKKYVMDCIKTNWISSEGSYVKNFESEMAAQVSRKYAVAVSSGTAALDIAIESLELDKGSEVIVPSFTIISTIHQILRSGLIPKFVDVNLDDWNIKVEDIEPLINSNTKAILIVHTYGLPADINSINKLAKKYNLKIIEDSAEVFGQTYKNKSCGSFGDISTFSFYSNKIVTTGEGGMVLTNNFKIYQKLLSLRNLCFQKNKRFIHENIGWNYRMTNIQGAIGISQLETYKKNIKKRISIAKTYNEFFKNNKNLQLPLVSNSFAKNIYWVYGLIIKNRFNSSFIRKKLIEENIDTRPFFYPLHKQPVLKSFNIRNVSNLPNSEYLYKKGFYIPNSLNLKKETIKFIADKINEITDS